MKSIFQEMADNWNSKIVTRTQVPIFTGGAIGDRYLANLDSQNQGPSGRFRIGRKVCYDVQKFVEWLESRSSKIEQVS